MEQVVKETKMVAPKPRWAAQSWDAARAATTAWKSLSEIKPGGEREAKNAVKEAIASDWVSEFFALSHERIHVREIRVNREKI